MHPLELLDDEADLGEELGERRGHSEAVGLDCEYNCTRGTTAFTVNRTTTCIPSSTISVLK